MLHVLPHVSVERRTCDVTCNRSIENPDEVETEVYEAEDIQDTILERTEQIKRFLKKKKHSEVTTEPHTLSGNSLQSSSLSAAATPFMPLVHPPQDTQSQLPSSSSHGSITSQSSVSRLPKLSLPTFTGEPLSWQTFWDCFSAAVGSSPTLSGVQKFSYLRAQLQGEATRAVAGFPLTDANYIHSVAILKERFGQTPKIVNAHMQALMNLPKLRNNVEDLRNLYDYIESLIRGLFSLAVTQ